MEQKKGRQRQTDGGLRNIEQAGINALGIYDSTNPATMQAATYPPGWLIARLRTPPPANPITRAQGKYLLNLIQTIGLEKYRGYKARLLIPLDTPVYRLTKGEAWQLIHHISQDLEAAR